MSSVKKVILLVVFTVFIIACEKPKTYSEIPKVSFKSLEIYDGVDSLGNEEKKIKITILVEDGDGNIGLSDTDTLELFKPLENKNLFINLYEKINGEFVKVDLQLPHNYRTPYIEPQGQNELLKADVEVSIGYSKLFFHYDTIKYDFYLYDRDLNKSNIEETPEIPTDTTGIITIE